MCKNNTNQADINSNPPIGVMKPIFLKSNEKRVLQAKKYIETEKNATPDTVNISMVFLALSVIKFVLPTNNKNSAWYTWYLTPVSKTMIDSGEINFFNPWAPNAPRAIATMPNIAAVAITFLSIFNILVM